MGRIELASPRSGQIDEPMKLEALAPRRLELLSLERAEDRFVARGALLRDGIERAFAGGSGVLGGGLDGGSTEPEKPGQAQQRAYAERRYLESIDVPNFKPVDVNYDPMMDAKLEELDRVVNERLDRYLKAFQAATDPKMQLYYRDLYVAMVTDKSDLANWRGLADHKSKAELYNRVAKEVQIEIKHNVAIVTSSGQPFTRADLEALETGLDLAGPRVVREGDLHFIHKQAEVVGARGRLAPASYDQGMLNLSDMAKGGFGGYTLQQIGLSKVPWGPYQDRLMASSGWQRVGDQNDPRTAKYNHGDYASAKELKQRGVPLPEGTPDTQNFRVTKKDGHVFIVPDAVGAKGTPRQVSTLAQDGPAEDFAATFALYRIDPEKLRTDFPEKFAVMWELEQAGHI